MTQDSKSARVDRLLKKAAAEKKQADDLRVKAEGAQNQDIRITYFKAALIVDRRAEEAMDQAAQILAQPPVKRTTERLIERTR